MVYEVKIISTAEASAICDRVSNGRFHTSKADIYGVCIKLLTQDRTFVEMWNDNFSSMSDNIRSHGQIITINDPSKGVEVHYDPVTSIAILYNFDYYGWVKSVALAIATDMLEDSHNLFAVHGAALDIDGRGVCIIAPSKTGKTTQSWGLLRNDNAHLITDDWFFVRLTGGRPRIHGSEKNCYIDADIGDVWEEYVSLVTSTKFDNKGRGIANIRWVMGQDSTVTTASLRDIILLKRDPSDGRTVIEMSADEALDYLVKNDFCNPHQMVRDERKMELRRGFYKRFLESCRVVMVNTVIPAKDTQELIKKALGIS
ncbi:MAG: HPr kinase/phosphorylase [Candidatus Methanomethylophilaceae archaeon]